MNSLSNHFQVTFKPLLSSLLLQSADHPPSRSLNALPDHYAMFAFQKLNAFQMPSKCRANEDSRGFWRILEDPEGSKRLAYHTSMHKASSRPVRPIEDANQGCGPVNAVHQTKIGGYRVEMPITIGSRSNILHRRDTSAASTQDLVELLEMLEMPHPKPVSGLSDAFPSEAFPSEAVLFETLSSKAFRSEVYSRNLINNGIFLHCIR